jgi:hypothetical protein
VSLRLSVFLGTLKHFVPAEPSKNGAESAANIVIEPAENFI